MTVVTNAADSDRSTHWVVIVPIKRLEIAKSRLSDTPPGRRRELALAFALDTIIAVRACSVVTSVVTVTDDVQAQALALELGAEVVPDEPDAGLNLALTHAESAVRQGRTRVGVVALSSDLPSLRPEELAAFIQKVEGSGPGRFFVRDVAGTGTSVLAATPAVELSPEFGPRSAARHRRSGAIEVDLDDARLSTLHRDVDTDVDLWDAVRLGVGPHTARVLAGNDEGPTHGRVGPSVSRSDG